MKTLIVVILTSLFVSGVCAEGPDCSGPERWPAAMAFVHLKNAKMTDNEKTDFPKVKAVQLASEKVRKGIYRQIHQVSIPQKSGKVIEVITSNEATDEECSGSGVDVFVISDHLGGR